MKGSPIFGYRSIEQYMLSTRTLLVALVIAAYANAIAQMQVTQSATGFDATIGPETLRVTVCADTILHIVTRPEGGDAKPAQPWLLPAAESCPGAHFDFAQDAKHATLKTAAITVSLDLSHGSLTFATAAGKNFLREGGNVPRTVRLEVGSGRFWLRGAGSAEWELAPSCSATKGVNSWPCVS